jgi:hypothetical protein
VVERRPAKSPKGEPVEGLIEPQAQNGPSNDAPAGLVFPCKTLRSIHLLRKHLRHTHRHE